MGKIPLSVRGEWLVVRADVSVFLDLELVRLSVCHVLGLILSQWWWWGGGGGLMLLSGLCCEAIFEVRTFCLALHLCLAVSWVQE